MQALVHLPRLYRSPRERSGIALGRLAPAEEAGAMAGGERRDLVEEEKLGPARIAGARIAAHHIPVPAAEVKRADDPGFRRPAARQQRPRRGIMDDPAIACEEPPFGRRMNLSERVDTVLKWYGTLPSTDLALQNRHAAKNCAAM